MLAEIKRIASSLEPRLIDIRHHLHSHPELSGEEHQTAAYVAGVLSSCGLPVTESVGKLGVVSEVGGEGAPPSQPLLAIRTDMDALPIQERTGLAYSSRNPGVMHACGHDMHTTIGLGTAMVLAQIQSSLAGRVRLLFQPAEETTQGARWMMQDGVMDQVAGILGLHVYPSIPVGTLGIRYGALTAAADDITLTIMGESGHGARPHEAIDAIWIAAQVITTLQQAISRTQNPLRPVVLTIGTISGGRATNVIADQVTMAGTVRCLHPETHAQLPGWIEDIVAGVCQTFGARYELDYVRGVPSVQNDPALTRLLETAAKEAWGDDRVQLLLEPSLGAEDFSCYLDQTPGTMMRLGVGRPHQTNYPLHHPLFVADDGAILTGVVTLAYAAWSYWQNTSV